MYAEVSVKLSDIHKHPSKSIF